MMARERIAALPPAEWSAYAEKLDQLVKVVPAGLPDANPSHKSRRVFRRKRQELIEMLAGSRERTE
jgi:hypothetical protein